MATYLSYIENRRDFPLYFRNFAIDHPNRGEWLQVKPNDLLKYSDLTKADRQKHIISPDKDKPIVIHFNQNQTFAVWQQDEGIYGKGWNGPTSDRPISDFSSYQNSFTPYVKIDYKEAHLCLCSDGEDFALIIDQPMGTVDGIGFLRLHSLHLDGGLSNYGVVSCIDFSGAFDNVLDGIKDRVKEAEGTADKVVKKAKDVAQSVVWDHLDELDHTISRELVDLEHTIERGWDTAVKKAEGLINEAEKDFEHLEHSFLANMANKEFQKVETTLTDIKNSWYKLKSEESKEIGILENSLKNGKVDATTVIAVKKMMCALLDSPIGNKIKDKFSGIGFAWNAKGGVLGGIVGEYGIGFNIWSLVQKDALEGEVYITAEGTFGAQEVVETGFQLDLKNKKYPNGGVTTGAKAKVTCGLKIGEGCEVSVEFQASAGSLGVTGFSVNFDVGEELDPISVELGGTAVVHHIHIG